MDSAHGIISATPADNGRVHVVADAQGFTSPVLRLYRANGDLFYDQQPDRVGEDGRAEFMLTAWTVRRIAQVRRDGDTATVAMFDGAEHDVAFELAEAEV